MTEQKNCPKRSRWRSKIVAAALSCSIFPAHAEVVEMEQHWFYAWMSEYVYRESGPEEWTPSSYDNAELYQRLDMSTPIPGNIATMVNHGSLLATDAATNTLVRNDEFPPWGWPNIPIFTQNPLKVDKMWEESENGYYRVMTNYWNKDTVLPDKNNILTELPLEVGRLRLAIENGESPAESLLGAFVVMDSPDSFWRSGRPRISGTDINPCSAYEYYSNDPCQWAPKKNVNFNVDINARTEGIHAPAAYPAIYKGCHYGQCTRAQKVLDPRLNTADRYVSGGANIAGGPFPIRLDTLTGVPSRWDTNVTLANIDYCSKNNSNGSTFCSNGSEMIDDAIFNVAYDIWFDRNTPRTEQGFLKQVDVDGDGFTDGTEPPWPFAVEAVDNSTTSPLLPEKPKLLRQTDGLEIMIWVANNGYVSQPSSSDGEVDPNNMKSVIRPAGNRVLTRVPIKGVSGIWDVWVTNGEPNVNASATNASTASKGAPLKNEYASWYVVSYVRVQEDDGKSIDLKTGHIGFQFDSKWFINHAANLNCGGLWAYNTATNRYDKVTNPAAMEKCLDKSWWMTSIQAGFEIWANGENLASKFFDVSPNTQATVVQGGKSSKIGYSLLDKTQPFLATANCEKPHPMDVGEVTVHHPNGPAETKAMVKDALGVFQAEFSGINMLENEALFEIDYRLTCGYIDPNTQLPKNYNVTKRVDAYNPGHIFDPARNMIPGSTAKLYYRPTTTASWIAIPDGSSEYFSGINHNNPVTAGQYGDFAWTIKKNGYYKVRAGFGRCHAPGNPSQPFIEKETVYIAAGTTVAAGQEFVLQCPQDGNEIANTAQKYCKWYSDGVFPMCKVDTGWWGWENNTNCISQSACDSTGNTTVHSDVGGTGGNSADDSDWLDINGIVAGIQRTPDGFGPEAVVPDIVVTHGPTISTYPISVRARGTSGSETVRLTVGGSVIATWTLGTNFETKTLTTDLAGGINVEYINDYGYYRDVVVDYVEINGVRYEAENQTRFSGSASGTGNCATGTNNGWIHCNGYIGFNAFK